MKKLICFFSRAGENWSKTGNKFIEKGYTEDVVEVLKSLLDKDTDVFRINPIKPYSSTYKECLQETMSDFKSKARPEIENFNLDISEYDEIYLAYPNYFGTAPMPVFSFLESLDLDGKIIHPICTNGGSGLANSIKDIQNSAPKAIVKEGLSIFGGQSETYKDLLSNWINK